MSTSHKLTKKDVKELVAKTYPDYTGRKFRLEIQSSYLMENYWDGGSRHYVVAVTLDGDVQEAQRFNPMNDQRAHAEFKLPDDIMLVEHTIFCGRDCGLSFIVSPNSKFLPKMLPVEATKENSQISQESEVK